jgi:hypothetical protein
MGDMSLPADYPTIPAGVYDEIKLVKLARQIAMGIKDLPGVLFDNDLTLREWDDIKMLPAFQRLLEGEVTSWEGALNTPDRVRIKAASMLEEYLPEMYARLNDRTEPLMAKMKAVELISKIAGFGQTDIPQAGSPGDKVQVIINLGSDTRLNYEKVLPHKVINHEPTTPAVPMTFEESIDAATNQV